MFSEKKRTYEEPNATMVQGSERSPIEYKESCKKLAEILHKDGWEIIAGAYGPMVLSAIESGANVKTHTAYQRGNELKGVNKVVGMEPKDCYEDVKKIDPENNVIEAWGYRNAKMIKYSGSYAIFKPDGGTFTHLIQAITFIEKLFSKEGTYRKIALMGWTKEEVQTLKKCCEVFNLTSEDAWNSESAWLKDFDLGSEEDAASYLTDRGENKLYQKK